MGEHFTFLQKKTVILRWSQQFEKGFQLLKVPNLGRKCWKTSFPVAQIEGCEVCCLSDRGNILELMYVSQREYTGRYYQVLATLPCLSHLDSHEYKAKCSMDRCASTACGIECYFKCNFMLGMSMANVWGCFCFALNDSLYYLFFTLFILGRNPLLCYLSLITVKHAKRKVQWFFLCICYHSAHLLFIQLPFQIVTWHCGCLLLQLRRFGPEPSRTAKTPCGMKLSAIRLTAESR